MEIIKKAIRTGRLKKTKSVERASRESRVIRESWK